MKSLLRARWPLLLGTLLVAACTTLMTRLGAPRDEIRFSHARHIEGGAECISCHEEVYDSTALGQPVLPAEKKCMECHKEKKAANECGFCHTVPEAPRTYAQRETGLKMDHSAHIERVEEDCGVCHASVARTGLLERSSVSMDTCLGCHEHKAQFSEARCDTCHEDLRRYALRPTSAFSHEGNFLQAHGRAARSATSSCATCHDQNFCTDCHASTVGTRVELRQPERMDRWFIHGGDFLARHSLEARANATSCQQCHGASSCSSCHREQGLTPGLSSAGGAHATSSLDPHPPGFNEPGSAQFHGPAARRDIASCAACHDQGAQSNCVECHRVGGIGGDPHPPGWSLRHGRDEINRNGMCLACHP